MSADPNVQRAGSMGQVRVDAEILSAEWLDNGEEIAVEENAFYPVPYTYGISLSVRIAKLLILTI
jgi:hypothetical protein